MSPLFFSLSSDRNFGAVLVWVCVWWGEGELKAFYGRKKKDDFWVSGLFMEWFSKAKSLTQKTRTKYPNEKCTIIHLWGRKKNLKKDELLVVIFATSHVALV